MKISVKEENSKNIGVFILQLSNSVVAMYLISKISSSQITVGSYVALTAAVITVQGSFAALWGSLGQIFDINLATKELMDILNDNYFREHLDDRLNVLNNIDSIEISNLSFTYPGTEKQVINNINLTIKKGERIAVVGDNGAGKSTLINIILGLYTTYSGKVQINEIDFKKVDLSSYNSRVSAVLQDFTKYMYSLKENVGLGNINKMENEEVIVDILKSVGLGKKVDGLKYGINTKLSKEYEDGAELSGGEWQKVAIARAMLKESDLIILDEPTAALDPLAKLEIFDLFSKIAQGRTTIMISHRLGITRYADKIIVLRNGEIVEQGTHDELINIDGAYKKMYESQAKWYK